MRVISINVGRPQKLHVAGRSVLTSIYKSPVTGPIRAGRRNLDGDQQSDLRVHGGANKTVYVYPWEHYAFWSKELGLDHLPYGAFGENLTVEGLLERTTRIGATLSIGSAEFEVTQPREPCFKLAMKFEGRDMIRRFLESERSGFYLRVTREGVLQAGDAITYAENDLTAPTIIDVLRSQADVRGSE
jgi:MOSC domain-containing protein YiiM